LHRFPVRKQDYRPEKPEAGPSRDSNPRTFTLALLSRRVPSVLFYCASAVLMTLASVLVFRSLDLGPEFAMSVLGSLIGGFLGAMLAAALIFDLYSKLVSEDGRPRDRFR
jgi:hypothetical protein